jgi:hypothetical protein
MSAPETSKFISNWIEYQNFLKKQDEFLGDLFNYQHGKKARYEYESVLIGLLHRYALNFRSVYRCWPDFLGNHRYKFSIYTLLRPLIADYLLMLYLLEEFKFLVPTDARNNSDEWQVKEDDFLKRFENISGSFFSRMDALLKKKVKKGEMSPVEFQDFLSHHANEFPKFFQVGSKIEVKKSSSPAPGQMVDEIVYGKPFVKDLYDYYFKMSQFEHFTHITEQLMSDPAHNDEMLYIVDLTNYLLDFLNINLGALRAPQEFKGRAALMINEFRSTEWLMDGSKATGK